MATFTHENTCSTPHRQSGALKLGPMIDDRAPYSAIGQVELLESK